VASAGPYASLHLAPDRLPRQHPTTQFFTGRMPFLPPNPQHQRTEGMLSSVTGCRYRSISAAGTWAVAKQLHSLLLTGYCSMR